MDSVAERNRKVKRRSTRWLQVILAATLLPLAACDDDGVGGTEGKTALSVYLTDQAGDVDKVWVEILSITLQGSEGSLELLDAPTGLILLTDLEGETHLLVKDAEVNPANYGQLRMQVGDAVLLSKEPTVYVKSDGEGLPEGLPEELEGLPRGTLQCPSCSQSGLKVTIPNDEMDIPEGDVTLVLDFNVAQSFGHKAGNSGKWVMHPVIHGTLSARMDIAGTVALETDGDGNPTISFPTCPEETTPRTIQDFIPTATLMGVVDGDGNPIVRSGTVFEDGSFTIGFLPPGTYDMGYEGSLILGANVLTFTATVEPEEVILTDASFDEMVYTITSATCEAGQSGQ
jgi:hypothetical protein